MTLLSEIMDGVVYVDLGGEVASLNPVAEELLGAQSMLAVGADVSALRGRGEVADALVAAAARVLAGEEREVERTVEVLRDDQELRYVRCATRAVLDHRREPAGVLAVLRDVTADFKSDQLRNQYLSIVAHELRTPLTGIKAFAAMMARGALGELNERQEEACSSIREQSVRLEHQIDKLVSLGDLESGDYGADRQVFGLDGFLQSVLAPFEQAARERGVALSLRCEARDVELCAARGELRRSCQALVENALKFTGEGGAVEVVVTAAGAGEDRTCRFHVRDDGVGVAPRYQRRIFEKFFQVEDPLTRRHGGAGLGLFVAQGVVAAHGDRIEVSSELGRGADFSFALPVHRPSPAGAAARGGSAEPASEGS
ncbi:MAG: ATP-binding protein [Planctomycetota bacterium]